MQLNQTNMSTTVRKKLIISDQYIDNITAEPKTFPQYQLVCKNADLMQIRNRISNTII